MKNLKQVEMIRNVLDKEREKLLLELSKINIYLNKKVSALQKVLAYQKEYAEGKHLNNTRSIPMLSKNLDTFSNKIKTIIINEEKEIEKLVHGQKKKLQEIESVDSKVRLMSVFSESIISEMLLKMEHIEQSSMDDLSANKKSRGGYE